jgi:hypothetical protein
MHEAELIIWFSFDKVFCSNRCIGVSVACLGQQFQGASSVQQPVCTPAVRSDNNSHFIRCLFVITQYSRNIHLIPLQKNPAGLKSPGEFHYFTE